MGGETEIDVDAGEPSSMALEDDTEVSSDRSTRPDLPPALDFDPTIRDRLPQLPSGEMMAEDEVSTNVYWEGPTLLPSAGAPGGPARVRVNRKPAGAPPGAEGGAPRGRRLALGLLGIALALALGWLAFYLWGR